MPADNEMVLGFTFDEIPSLAEELQMEWPSDLDGYIQLEDIVPEDVLIQINKRLIDAHKLACGDMDFKIKKFEDHCHFCETPLGLREMFPFILSLYYDPDEIGDSPQDMILGVSVSGRYSPTFVDWRNPNGTLGLISTKSNKEMQIAQDRIVEALPFMKNASFYIKMKWY